MAERLQMGGMAVTEGVLMKSKDKAAAAVRTNEGNIETTDFGFTSLTNKHFFSWPFIRGVFIMIETVYLGLKAISWSTNKVAEEEEELTRTEIIATIIFSLLFAMILFKLIPLSIASLIPQAESNNLLFNTIDGIAKVLILVAYIWLISQMEDIKKIFQYHGAEHKTINAFDHGLELTTENVQKQPKEHPACGTSFILLVLLLSILFYMIIPITSGFWIKYLYRILLLPAIAGVSYEVIKLAHKKPDNILFKIITYPGIMLQWITTREPEDQMIEVAKAALEEVNS